VVTVHIVLGLITLIVAALTLVWTGIRLSQGWKNRPSFYRVLVGLLDLQALLGIITLVLHPQHGWWLLHPVFMLGAVAIGHVYLKDKRSTIQQLSGVAGIVVLILIGVWIGKM